MPPGTTVKGIHAHGASYWSRTAEIQTLRNDGSPQSYYIKATQNRFGLKMFHGEYESSKAIYDVCPDFIPEPIAYGTFASIPNTHFYLSQFIDMADELPDIDTFPEKLAELHKKATSSQYGFHYQTMTALLPLYHIMAAEKLAQGPASEEQLRLESVFFERIIPRLIRPLETGGRQIQPRLVHSDLWDGNAAVNVEDGGSLEMGPRRVPRHRTGKPYIEMYHKFFPKSAPEEDHDGRNLLYSV
ncbi:hypothetical protein NA56DRAFT_670370 [Hyaloscypha hepaticicola]|uniref:protein-ribulosamine 3-kinase n=1 Tax=Hyaloscypha hepaticicola TaxID=2082293 RepID=A0A2J6Q7L9_9HELO|nr:hypothetical protein NA56DRAFT_670370 [Hyaloscypha hepaticicola]